MSRNLSPLRRAICLMGVLVIFGSATCASTRAEDNQIGKIREQFFAGNFGEVISSYTQLSAVQRDNPLVCFWVGQSYLRRRDIEHSEEYLRKAEAGRLGVQQRERADSALARLGVLKQLRPPFLHDYEQDGYKIRIFAKDTLWSKGIAKQIPTFFARAKEGFGNQNALITFYLFEDRSSYDKFFDSWVVDPKEGAHRGTGGMQILEYCRVAPTGKIIGEKDINDLYSRVLHEYSHALCNTIYGDNFRMPEWLNEGMADYFGWKYKPTGPAEAKVRLAKFAALKPARSYEDVTTRLHEDNETGYAIGDVMVTELMKGKPLSVYGEIINGARAKGGNFEAAVQQTTGQDPRALYAEIVKTYWKAK